MMNNECENDELKSIIQEGDVHKTNNGERLLFNPFNQNNKEITKNIVETILSKYGINKPITNVNLYKRAFVHKSYVKRPAIENQSNNISIAPNPRGCLSLRTKSNERLEFLGDGILENITKFYLYRRFPKENEGFMTEKKISIVKNEMIGKFAYDIGLNKWYIMSRHAEEKKTRTNLKKLGCLFEAFLGAIFLDFNKKEINDTDGLFNNVFTIGPGFQFCQLFLERVFEEHINWIELITQNDNYKNILQIKIQKEFKITPSYKSREYTDEEGYDVGVYLCIGDIIQNYDLNNSISTFKTYESIHEYVRHHNVCIIKLGEGKHKIKKKAEQLACFMAINNIE